MREPMNKSQLNLERAIASSGLPHGQKVRPNNREVCYIKEPNLLILTFYVWL